MYGNDSNNGSVSSGNSHSGSRGNLYGFRRIISIVGGKTAHRDSLLCETKKFEIMTDIKFAKAHMGEYFQWRGRKVRVIGYKVMGSSYAVIVDCVDGWSIIDADYGDIINSELFETGMCRYVAWEDLK